jgi:CubicO group peptidase (beta-lactamase class C family)
MSQQNTPGVAIALTSREEARTFVYGSRELASGRRIQEDTLFQIGSIGKAFTAVSILQLCDDGRISLDQPPSRYLPWLKVRSRYPAFNIHHLLTHTAGLSANREDLPSSLYQSVDLRNRWTEFAPGSRFAYSNSGYQLLGHLIEEVTGKRYGEYVRERILAPLSMTNAEPSISSAIRSRLAVGYCPIFDDRPVHPSQPLAPATWVDWTSADGSIAASATDLSAFVRMLLNRGVGPHGRVLSEHAFELMKKPATHIREDRYYGYGIGVRQVGDHTLLYHSGGMVGYSAVMIADFQGGLGVAVCMNGPGNAAVVAEFALTLLQAVSRGNPLPNVRGASIELANGSQYAGVYTSPSGKKLTVLAEPGGLFVSHLGKKVPLEERSEDWFYANDPDFDTFLIGFHRDSVGAVEAFHGSEWFRGERYRGPMATRAPKEWEAFTGHYRSYNPWLPSFRVVLRKGRLWFADPASTDKPLSAISPGFFQVDDSNAAERIRFDTVVRSRAQRAVLSGAAYYRVGSP